MDFETNNSSDSNFLLQDHFSYNFTKNLDEMLIKVEKSRKNLNIVSLLWLELVRYYHDLFFFMLYFTEKKIIAKKSSFK